MDKKVIIGFILGIIVIMGGIIAVAAYQNKGENRQDLTAFVGCLKDKGAVFYGAWWCPHCAATKKLFGAAKKDLPYVECSAPDGKTQYPVCIEKQIASYPTWIFADGSRLTGEQSLEALAAKTNCELPSASASTADLNAALDKIVPQTGSSSRATQ